MAVNTTRPIVLYCQFGKLFNCLWIEVIPQNYILLMFYSWDHNVVWKGRKSGIPELNLVRASTGIPQWWKDLNDWGVSEDEEPHKHKGVEPFLKISLIMVCSPFFSISMHISFFFHGFSLFSGYFSFCFILRLWIQSEKGCNRPFFHGYVTPWVTCPLFGCLPSPLVMAVYIASISSYLCREHICTYV